MSEFSIQLSDKSSEATVLQRNPEELAKKLPSSRATMVTCWLLQSYWATNEIQKPWRQGYMEPRNQSYLATSMFPERLNFQRYWITWFLGSGDPGFDRILHNFS
ncbi:hypothetical protein PIB30_095873 [Stylosanthes scabra]|uniref:Uncharacterized protein n=1 Tax=Stylosanthes scabra TaxID=79078 RepID=A0ABU6VV01_9FABA|nr:hypothetical protein [Stylosanthes scabra]